jgi:S1-C subfamily serine protease
VRRCWLIAAALLVPGCGGDAHQDAAGPTVFQVKVGPDEVATGFALGPDAAVTVAHVFEDRIPADATRLGDGRRAGVQFVDRANDVALLSIPGLHAPATRFGTASGDVVVLVMRRDHVRALSAHIRRSISARIATLDGHVVRRPALELAADIAPGDSGAPVVTGDGRVAGVIFAQSNKRAHTAYATAVSALAVLRQLAADRS